VVIVCEPMVITIWCEPGVNVKQRHPSVGDRQALGPGREGSKRNVVLAKRGDSVAPSCRGTMRFA
jgi:hypothetical protein